MAASAAYKVTYFDITALGEPIRMLLSYGNVDFEDNRIDYEQWATIKPTLNLPYGQLPILEHDGKRAHQSLAICRYVAKKVKLVGKDDWEDLEIDAAAETINDLRTKIGAYHYEKDPDVKEQKKAPLFNEILPQYLEKLEEQIKNNNGYLAVGRLTWADVYFVGLLKYVNFMLGKDLTENSPGLSGINEKVCALPGVKAWLEKRPKTAL